MEPNPKRILVVDDDALVRRMVATILKRAGNFVQTAEDGESAWEALQNWHLQLVGNRLQHAEGVRVGFS